MFFFLFLFENYYVISLLSVYPHHKIYFPGKMKIILIVIEMHINKEIILEFVDIDNSLKLFIGTVEVMYDFVEKKKMFREHSLSKVKNNLQK